MIDDTEAEQVQGLRGSKIGFARSCGRYGLVGEPGESINPLMEVEPFAEGHFGDKHKWVEDVKHSFRIAVYSGKIYRQDIPGLIEWLQNLITDDKNAR